MPNLAPSEALLNAAQKGRITWSEFGSRYRKELREVGSIDGRNRSIRPKVYAEITAQRLARSGNVTLMCHAVRTNKGAIGIC